MTAENDTVVTVNKRELARVFKTSEPTIDTWIEQGCPVEKQGGNGVAYEFVFADVVSWRREVEERAVAAAAERHDQIAQIELGLTGGTIADAETARLPARERGLAIDAERKALMLAKEKGELLERAQVDSDYAAVFSLLNQRLLGMASLLGRLLRLPPDQIAMVEKEMRALLSELALQITDPDLRPKIETPDAA